MGSSSRRNSAFASSAGKVFRELRDAAHLDPNLPLLLVYDEPVSLVDISTGDAPLLLTRARLDSFFGLLNAGLRCRLVNLSCMSVPGIISWCLNVADPRHLKNPLHFGTPDPFEALLALEWLKEHPEFLQAYQELESHPLAAALDGRPPDLDCLERYRQAASLDALLAARQERMLLEDELSELAEQLQPLREQQFEALVLREQLALLQARLREADALEERCSELQLSLQAQQLDLEQLVRRLALLEELVGAGSHASLRLQERLAHALSG